MYEKPFICFHIATKNTKAAYMNSYEIIVEYMNRRQYEETICMKSQILFFFTAKSMKTFQISSAEIFTQHALR